jgi:hypothetical protein
VKASNDQSLARAADGKAGAKRHAIEWKEHAGSWNPWRSIHSADTSGKHRGASAIWVIQVDDAAFLDALETNCGLKYILVTIAG